MHDIFPAGVHQSIVGGRGLSSAVGHAEEVRDQSGPLQVGADERRSVVRSVVDNDDLQVVIGLFAQCFEQMIEVLPLVLARREDSDERALREEGAPRFLLAAPAAVPCQSIARGGKDIGEVIARELDENKEPIGRNQIVPRQIHREAGHYAVDYVESIVDHWRSSSMRLMNSSTSSPGW